MKKYLHWFIVNGLYTSLFIVGIMLPNKGLINIGVIATVFLLLVSILLLSVMAFLDELEEVKKADIDKIMKSLTEDRTRFYNFLDYSYDWGMLAFFSYQGFWFTTVIYFLHLILIWVARTIAQGRAELKKI